MTSILLRFTLAIALVTTIPLAAVAQTLVPAVTFRTSSATNGDEWPADFNRDGITDLVATTLTGEVQVRIGNGNGTFRAPIVSATRAVPMATGDLNGDGRVDVVARGHVVPELLVLPGNSDGTLGAPVTVARPQPVAFALVADLDNDGRLDLATGYDAEGNYDVDIRRGNGDFTFAPPITIVTDAEGPRAGIVTDVNGDGLRDIAIAYRFPFMTSAVRLLLNQGDLAFAVSAVASGSGFVSDVTARDVTGDGEIDLVISGRGNEDFGRTFTYGYVFVAIGNGDGSFAAGDQFPTGRGANSIVVGDFTHDGITDVATANHSYWADDDGACGIQVQDANSLSILAGRSDGTFGLPTSFALGPQTIGESAFGGPGFGTLNTSDINRDGFPDLITGSGTILLTTVPKPNRAPTVSTGPDRPFIGPDVLVLGTATDPDGHFLSFSWTGGAGGRFEIDNAPAACYWADSPGGEQLYGLHELQLTVSDGNGGVDTDTVVLDYPQQAPPSELAIVRPGESDMIHVGVPFTIRWEAHDPAIRSFDLSFSGGSTYQRITECENLPASARECTWISPGPAVFGPLFLRGSRDTGATTTWTFVRVLGSTLPPGWESRDIGGVGAAGAASFFDGSYMVRGSGADIWGRSDEFHFAFTSITGDFEISTRVEHVENVNPWTKAGLMVRSSVSARAAHASIFATPTLVKGVSLQTRAADGGTSVERARVAAVPPALWLRLIRRGTSVRASYRDASTDQWIDLPDTTVALGDTVLVGFAVSSHVDGTSATAQFSDVVLARPSGLPPGVTSADIGRVDATGGATFDGTTFTVRGSGADIWGRADEFHYVSMTATGDFAITARVASVENVNQWTKAGLMIREDSGAGARHASLFVTPTTAKPIAFQRRTTAGGLSTHTSGPALTAPVWIRLVRFGDSVAAYVRPSSTDEWVLVGVQALTGLPANVLVGLAVSSHADGQLATATFDNVTLSQDASQSTDVGSVGVAGTTTLGDAGLAIEGSGGDIWGTADSFRFHHQSRTGDGTITVRVSSIEGTHPWAKAGVMFRESLDANSKHIMAIVSSSRGVAVQYRATTGGASGNVAISTGSAPEWLRLTREGDTFSAFGSEDGDTWQLLGTLTLSMNATVDVGLALTSHDNSTLATALFDSITVTP